MSAGPKWAFVLACAASTLAATGGCGKVENRAAAARRPPGLCRPTSLEGWRFAAVYLLSARAGVGVTASGVLCPVSSGEGWQRQAEPVRVAVTHDGGRTWRGEGAVLPVAPAAYQPIAEQVLAASTSKVYVLAGNGEVLASTDAEATWVPQPLPRPVLQLAMSARTIWALSCPTTSNRVEALCRPVLERADAHGGPWTPVAIPPVTHVLDVHLAVASKNLEMLDIDHPGGGRSERLYTLDGGRRWSRERYPKWDGFPCVGTVVFAASAPHTWWTLCLGNAAAGSSTKGLLRATDYGRTWTTVSQVRSLLTTQPNPTSISRAEPDALAAGSPTRLWLAYQNTMGESRDGGKTWTDVPGINPQGVGASFDVLSSTHAWLALPGDGLWRTTDGSHWTLATLKG